MDARFSIHNSHLQYRDYDDYVKHDAQLVRLFSQPKVFVSDLVAKLALQEAGIYSLAGGRQVGKTTLLKQVVVKLLQQGIWPENISFITGELIDDHHSLLNIMMPITNSLQDGQLGYLFIDEVTYIKDWDKAIKYAADSGMLEDFVVVLTGSDMVLMQEARMRFPGRRGKSEQVDFHLYPLSFRQYVMLEDKAYFEAELDNKVENISDECVDRLFALFSNYLIHGGYLTAINDMASYEKILPATLMTYSDWVRGDVVKRGKSEAYLRELLSAIIKCYGSQITWNSISHHLSISHPSTVADYVELLQSMDALFIQPALLEDKLVAAPKKAKKLMFADSFIYHAIRFWLSKEVDPYSDQILVSVTDAEISSKIVESVVVNHYRRFYPTYYIKAQGEVDVAYVDQNKFWPVEVKWQKHVLEKDLMQLAKYKNPLLLSKTKRVLLRGNIKELPLPLALALMEG